MTDALDQFDSTPARPELWTHVRTNDVYELLMPAVIEATQQAVVVYRSLVTGIRWVRPSTEFYDGRFVRIGPPTAQDQKT